MTHSDHAHAPHHHPQGAIRSALMMSAVARLAVAAGLSLVLWGLVAWALR